MMRASSIQIRTRPRSSKLTVYGSSCSNQICPLQRMLTVRARWPRDQMRSFSSQPSKSMVASR